MTEGSRSLWAREGTTRSSWPPIHPWPRRCSSVEYEPVFTLLAPAMRSKACGQGASAAIINQVVLCRALTVLMLLVLAGLVSCAREAPPQLPRLSPSGEKEAARHQGPLNVRFVAPQAYHAFMEAELALHFGERLAARQHLSRALVEDPESPELRLRLAELVFEEGSSAEALRLAMEARSVDPNYPRAYIVEARLVRREAPGRALALLRRALVLDPGRGEIYLRSAPLERRIHGVQAERRAFEALLAAVPLHLDGLLGLARAHARTGRLEEAKDVLRRAIHAHPFATDPWLQLARIRIREGQWDEAARWLYRGLEATGDDPFLAEELFRLWLVQGRPDRARDLVDLLKGHQSGAGLTFAATLLERLGDAARAKEMLKLALVQDPSHGPAYLQLARLRGRQGETQAARRLLEAVDPESEAWSAVQIELAANLEADGRFQEAERRLLAVQAVHPQEPSVLESLAFLQARRGRMRTALESLERARRARGEGVDEPGYRYVLILILEEGGRWPEAMRLAKELLLEDPDDPLVLNAYGYGLAERGLDQKIATRHLRQALRLDPLNPYILDSYGWALTRQGLLSSAIQALERAVLLDRRLCEGWAHLGEARMKAGLTEAARRAWLSAHGCATSKSARAVYRGRLQALAGQTLPLRGPRALRARARSFR